VAALRCLGEFILSLILPGHKGTDCLDTATSPTVHPKTMLLLPSDNGYKRYAEITMHLPMRCQRLWPKGASWVFLLSWGSVIAPEHDN
jgi:hypothetical protein